MVARTAPANLFNFTLSASGTTIGRSTGIYQSGWTITRQITDITGGSLIWSDSFTSDPDYLNPILLSPDGTLAAETTGPPGENSTATIIKNGALLTVIPGFGVGWLDNGRILVNHYATGPGNVIQYNGCSIYSPAGVVLAAPPLPELNNIQKAGTDTVYDPSRNAIYSLTTGQPAWTGSFPTSGVGAVAGAYVVYASGHTVVVESH